MKVWYNNYESQCWYSNTFLVNEFQQISRAVKGEKEWNNVMESGCNFTCLAMMIGVNPAYLASELKKKNFFKPDRSVKSKKLNGEYGYLVWDKNEPYKKKNINLKDVLVPSRGVKNLRLKFVDEKFTSNLDEANNIIRKTHAGGLHIICGYDDHSRLVAGKKNGEYFLWDPDLESTRLRKNLKGDYTIKWFFNAYRRDKEFKNEKAEFCIYSVEYY